MPLRPIQSCAAGDTWAIALAVTKLCDTTRMRHRMPKDHEYGPRIDPRKDHARTPNRERCMTGNMLATHAIMPVEEGKWILRRGGSLLKPWGSRRSPRRSL